MTQKIKRVLGWKPQLPDFRDYTPIIFPVTTLISVDLRSQFPPVYDQGQLGSCTGNGNAAIYEYTKMKQGKDYFVPSRLKIYFDERTLEDTVKQDAGAQIRDGIKVMATMGVCPETMWPYDVTKFKQKPPKSCYDIAVKNEVESYSPVTQTLEQLRGCLVAGYPVVFGITLYDSFQTQQVEQTGIVPTPQSTETVDGGHCMVLVGYDDSKQWFIVRNSWGDSWGDKGYCYIPYDYFLKMASDLWMIKLVE